MIFQYLGTGAAEGWPGLFCGCGNCETARKLGGRNIRTRSQAVIYKDELKGEALLIDFPPDTYQHCLQHGLRLDKLSHLIITHSHHDHYAVDNLEYRMEWYCDRKGHTLNIYGNETVREKYYEMLGKHKLTDADTETVFHTVEYFKPFSAGAFTVTPLKANHGAPEQCMLYLISGGGKTVFYANDTGTIPEETWEYLKGKRLDMVSLDCTNGDLDISESSHMGLKGCAAARDRLREAGCIDGSSRVVVNHFSHNGNLHYDAMVEAAKAYGIEVSFDGGIWEL
jgi:phosphoribosyl 1,2-cyclic phosphate phosphodiesterase